MVKGIGIDIIEIHRIILAMERNNKFLYRIFTEKEREYFLASGENPSTIAGNFAAKEAVVKALGTGLRFFKWIDIEISRDSLGKPNVVLYNGAKEVAQNQEITKILVTISHSREYAVAQAMAL